MGNADGLWDEAEQRGRTTFRHLARRVVLVTIAAVLALALAPTAASAAVAGDVRAGVGGAAAVGQQAGIASVVMSVVQNMIGANGAPSATAEAAATSKSTMSVKSSLAAQSLLSAQEGATYTISFDANGGTGAMADIVVDAGDSVTALPCTFGDPSETQYFNGWKDASGTAVTATASAPYTPTGDITLYAQWSHYANYAMYDSGTKALTFLHLAEAPADTATRTYWAGEGEDGWLTRKYGAAETPWYGVASSITSVRFDDKVAPAHTAFWFYGFSQIDTLGVSGIDACNFGVSEPSSACGMFSGCLKLASLDLSGFDTAKVSDMSWMFRFCSSLTSLDLSGFDTSAATTMSGMFYSCSSLTSLDLSGFDTSKVSDMSCMFDSCSKLTSLDITGFDASSLVNTMQMFKGDQALERIYVAANTNWSLSPNINESYSYQMFDGCTSIRGNAGTTYSSANIKISYAHVDGLRAQPGYFTDASLLEKYAVFDSSDGTLTFDRDNAGRANGSTVGTKTYYSGVESISASQKERVPWDSKRSSVKKVVFKCAVAPVSMAYWFTTMENLTEVEGMPLLDTSRVTSMLQTFLQCKSLTSLDVSHFNTSNVTSMQQMFSTCNAVTSLDVSGFDTSKVTSMAYMFRGCTSLPSLNVSSFDTSKVKNMTYLFQTCSKLTSLDVTGFDTSSATDMSYMFGDCSLLESLDVTGFDTAKVSNMSGMFYNCKKLESLDVSNFDTSSATNMTNMFANCPKLMRIYAAANTDWSMSSKLSSSSGMFTGCSAIMGGNGTTYSGSSTGGGSARVDGLNGSSGYFTQVGYTVRYVANGGSGNMDDDEFDYGTEGALSANAFTAPNPIGFQGWAQEKIHLSAWRNLYPDAVNVVSSGGVNTVTYNTYGVWETLTSYPIAVAPGTEYTLSFSYQWLDGTARYSASPDYGFSVCTSDQHVNSDDTDIIAHAAIGGTAAQTSAARASVSFTPEEGVTQVWITLNGGRLADNQANKRVRISDIELTPYAVMYADRASGALNLASSGVTTLAAVWTVPDGESALMVTYHATDLSGADVATWSEVVGDGGYSVRTFTELVAADAAFVAPTRHVFGGWRTQPLGTGDLYNESQQVEVPSGGLNLYVEWKPMTVEMPLTGIAGGAPWGLAVVGVVVSVVLGATVLVSRRRRVGGSLASAAPEANPGAGLALTDSTPAPPCGSLAPLIIPLPPIR